ncbi:MAG: ABC transporter permease [Desulfobacteraceae bacterium]|nr:ABC transporter permease [Desulfobacteraceae bacterium]
MFAYIVRRTIFSLFLVVIVSILLFVVLRVIPGDPAAIMLGFHATPSLVEQLTRDWGLDKSVHVQYWLWIRGVLTGNLGISISSGQPVSRMIGVSLPITVTLSLLSTFFAFVIGSIVGVGSAVSRRKLSDFVITLFSYVGISTPGFFLGILLIWIFAVTLRVFPSMGYTPINQGLIPWLRHFTLPTLTIALINGAATGRIVRTSMLEVISQDYVRTAESKGLSQFVVVMKHAYRNAMLPVFTAAGVQFAYNLGGVVIIEQVFAIPGLGRLMLHSILGRDYPVIQAAVLLFAAMLVITNLIIDIAYSYVDPRVVYELDHSL